MAVPVRIERLDPDSDLAAELLTRYYAELDRRFPGGFDIDKTVAAPAAELRAPYGAFLGVFVGSAPVGCGAVRRMDGRTAEIKRMWVDAGVRGKGLGRQLLAALETTARDLACVTVRLDTSDQLAEALQLYRSADYRDIPAYNDNCYAAHWLEKSLR